MTSGSTDDTEAETEGDNDVVDDITWPSMPVSTVQRLDFTGKSGMTCNILVIFDDRHFEHSCTGVKLGELHNMATPVLNVTVMQY